LVLTLRYIRLPGPNLQGSDDGGNLRAVFLKAAGGKTFCAGGDLKAMKVGGFEL